MIVGTGLYILPRLILSQVGPMNTILGWLLIILFMVPFVYIYSRLGERMPNIDGIAKYAELLFGWKGNIYVSFIILGGLITGMPAFFIMTGNFVNSVIGSPSSDAATFIALSIALLSTVVNILGKNYLNHMNRYVLPQVLIIISILFYFLFDTIFNDEINFTRIDFVNHFSIHGTWLAASIAFWAFQGWESLSHSLEEFKDPKKNISKAYWISFIIVSFLYLFYVFIEIFGLFVGKNSLISSVVPNIITNKFFSISFIVLALSLVFVNSNSWSFAASRANYSFSAKGILPNKLMHLNSKNVPIYMFQSQFLIYSLIILLVWYFKIPIESMLLLTTQCFIVLYGVVILVFIKQFKKWRDRIVGGISFLIWLSIISGFSWYLLYPLLLVTAGIVFYRKKYQRKAKNHNRLKLHQ